MAERGFENLEFYQDSLKLLKAAYRLAGEMPDYERYNLADQLRRAACSVALNIAEGYGRYHYLERLRFMYIARGSLAETCSAFIIAKTVGYCTEEQLRWVVELRERIERQLNGYCRFIRSQQQGGAEYGTKYVAEEYELYDLSQSPIPSTQSTHISETSGNHEISQSLIPNPQSLMEDDTNDE
ncbi:MAG TPA: four helix bundle protein [Roseiflexaceae bacterium]|nr:four helix bundle protein [Roseiflexaceae bacterium]